MALSARRLLGQEDENQKAQAKKVRALVAFEQVRNDPIRGDDARKSVSSSLINNEVPATKSGTPTSAVAPSASSATYIAQLISVITRNVQLVARRISVGFAFSYPGLPESMKYGFRLTVKELYSIATDEAWQPRFVSDLSQAMYRTLYMEGASFVVSVWSQSNHQALEVPFLSDVTATLFLRRDSDGAMEILLKTLPVAMQVDMGALSALAAFTGYLQKGAAQANNMQFLPQGACSVWTISAAQRWLYAIRCVLKQVKDRHPTRRLAWESIKKFVQVRDAFVALTKRREGVSWLPPLTAEEQGVLTRLEEQLTLHQIVFLRCWAYAQLQLEQMTKNIERQNIARATARTAPRPSWGSWLAPWQWKASPPQPAVAVVEEAGSAVPSATEEMDLLDRELSSAARFFLPDVSVSALDVRPAPVPPKRLSVTVDIPRIIVSLRSSEPFVVPRALSVTWKGVLIKVAGPTPEAPAQPALELTVQEITGEYTDVAGEAQTLAERSLESVNDKGPQLQISVTPNSTDGIRTKVELCDVRFAVPDVRWISSEARRAFPDDGDTVDDTSMRARPKEPGSRYVVQVVLCNMCAILPFHAPAQGAHLEISLPYQEECLFTSLGQDQNCTVQCSKPPALSAHGNVCAAVCVKSQVREEMFCIGPHSVAVHLSEDAVKAEVEFQSDICVTLSPKAVGLISDGLILVGHPAPTVMYVLKESHPAEFDAVGAAVAGCSSRKLNYSDFLCACLAGGWTVGGAAVVDPAKSVLCVTLPLDRSLPSEGFEQITISLQAESPADLAWLLCALEAMQSFQPTSDLRRDSSSKKAVDCSVTAPAVRLVLPNPCGWQAKVEMSKVVIAARSSGQQIDVHAEELIGATSYPEKSRDATFLRIPTFSVNVSSHPMVVRFECSSPLIRVGEPLADAATALFDVVASMTRPCAPFWPRIATSKPAPTPTMMFSLRANGHGNVHVDILRNKPFLHCGIDNVSFDFSDTPAGQQTAVAADVTFVDSLTDQGTTSFLRGKDAAKVSVSVQFAAPRDLPVGSRFQNFLTVQAAHGRVCYVQAVLMQLVQYASLPFMQQLTRVAKRPGNFVCEELLALWPSFRKSPAPSELQIKMDLMDIDLNLLGKDKYSENPSGLWLHLGGIHVCSEVRDLSPPKLHLVPDSIAVIVRLADISGIEGPRKDMVVCSGIDMCLAPVGGASAKAMYLQLCVGGAQLDMTESEYAALLEFIPFNMLSNIADEASSASAEVPDETMYMEVAVKEPVVLSVSTSPASDVMCIRVSTISMTRVQSKKADGTTSQEMEVFVGYSEVGCSTARAVRPHVREEKLLEKATAEKSTAAITKETNKPSLFSFVQLEKLATNIHLAKGFADPSCNCGVVNVSIHNFSMRPTSSSAYFIRDTLVSERSVVSLRALMEGEGGSTKDNTPLSSPPQPVVAQRILVEMCDTRIDIIEPWGESLGSLDAPKLVMDMQMLAPPNASLTVQITVAERAALRQHLTGADCAHTVVGEILAGSDNKVCVWFTDRPMQQELSSQPEIITLPKFPMTLHCEACGIRAVVLPHVVLRLMNNLTNEMAKLSSLSLMPEDRRKRAACPSNDLIRLQVVCKELQVSIPEAIDSTQCWKLIVGSLSLNNAAEEKILTVPVTTGGPPLKYALAEEVMTICCSSCCLQPLLRGAVSIVRVGFRRPLVRTVCAVGHSVPFPGAFDMTINAGLESDGPNPLEAAVDVDLINMCLRSASLGEAIRPEPFYASDTHMNMVLHLSAPNLKIVACSVPPRPTEATGTAIEGRLACEPILSVRGPLVVDLIVHDSSVVRGNTVKVRLEQEACLFSSKDCRILSLPSHPASPEHKNYVQLCLRPTGAVEFTLEGVTFFIVPEVVSLALRLQQEFGGDSIQLPAKSKLMDEKSSPLSSPRSEGPRTAKQNAINVALRECNVVIGQAARLHVGEVSVSHIAAEEGETCLRLHKLRLGHVGQDGAFAGCAVEAANIHPAFLTLGTGDCLFRKGEIEVKTDGCTYLHSPPFVFAVLSAIGELKSYVMKNVKFSRKEAESFRQTIVVTVNNFGVILGANNDAECMGEETSRSDMSDDAFLQRYFSERVELSTPTIVVKYETTVKGSAPAVALDAMEGTIRLHQSGRVAPLSLCSALSFSLSISSNSESNVRIQPLAVFLPPNDGIRVIALCLSQGIVPFTGPIPLVDDEGDSDQQASAQTPKQVPNGSFTLDAPQIALHLAGSDTEEPAAGAAPRSMFSVELSGFGMNTRRSHDSESFELRLFKLTSSATLAATAQAAPLTPITIEPSTDGSKAGVFVKRCIERPEAEATIRTSVTAKMGSTCINVSPSLLAECRSRYVGPAALGWKMYRKKAVIVNAAPSRKARPVCFDTRLVDADTVLSTDFHLNSHQKLRFMSSKTNVIHVKGANRATVFLSDKNTRPIIIDEGMSVYSEGVRYILEHPRETMDQFLCLGERSFFNVENPQEFIVTPSPTVPRPVAAPAGALVSATLERTHSVDVAIPLCIVLSHDMHNRSIEISGRVEARYSGHTTSDSRIAIAEEGEISCTSLGLVCDSTPVSGHGTSLGITINHLKENPPTKQQQPSSERQLGTTLVTALLGPWQLTLKTCHLQLMLEAARSLWSIGAVLRTPSDETHQSGSPRFEEAPTDALGSAERSNLQILVNVPELQANVCDDLLAPTARVALRNICCKMEGARDLSSASFLCSGQVCAEEYLASLPGWREALTAAPEIEGSYDALEHDGQVVEFAMGFPNITVSLSLPRISAIANAVTKAISSSDAYGPDANWREFGVQNDTGIALVVKSGESGPVVRLSPAIGSRIPIRSVQQGLESVLYFDVDRGEQQQRFVGAKVDFGASSAETMHIVIGNGPAIACIVDHINHTLTLRSEVLLRNECNHPIYVYGFQQPLDPLHEVAVPVSLLSSPLRFMLLMQSSLPNNAADLLWDGPCATGCASIASLQRVFSLTKKNVLYLPTEQPIDTGGVGHYTLQVTRTAHESTRLVISPALTLKNETPMTLTVHQVASAEEASKSPDIRVAAYSSVPLYSSNYSSDSLAVQILARVAGDGMPPLVSTAFDLKLVVPKTGAADQVCSMCNPLDRRLICLHSQGGRDGGEGNELRCAVHFHCGQSTLPTIEVSVAGSLRNCLSRPVLILDMAGKPLCGQTSKGLEPGAILPLSFPAEGEPQGGVPCVQASLSANATHSNPLYPTAVGTSYPVVCRQGVVSHVCSLRCKTRQRADLVPLWSIHNDLSDLPIQFMVCGLPPGVLPKVIPPSSQSEVTLTPVDKYADPEVRLSVPGESEWTAPIPLASLQTGMGVRLEVRDSGDSASNVETTSSTTIGNLLRQKAFRIARRDGSLCSFLALWIEVRRSHGTVSLHVSSRPGDMDSAALKGVPWAPLILENRSPNRIFLQQVGSVKQYVLEPFSSAPFAWDPYRPAEYALSISSSKNKRPQIIIPSRSTSLRSVPLDDSTYCFVMFNASNFCHIISCTTDRLLEARYIHCPTKVRNVTLYLRELVVFVSSAEAMSANLLFMAVHGVLFHAADNEDQLLVNMSLDTLRVEDCSTMKPLHPVALLFEGRRIPDGGDSLSPALRGMLHLRERSSNRAGKVVHVQDLQVHVGVLHVLAHDTFVSSLLNNFTAFLRSVENGTKSEPSEVLSPAVPLPSVKDNGAVASTLVLDKLYISPIAAFVTLSRRYDGVGDPFAALPVLVNLCIRSVESAPVSLSETAMSDIQLPAPALVELLIHTYKQRLLRQVLYILGSFEALGNPVALIRNVSGGLRDFVVGTASLHPLQGAACLASSATRGTLHSLALLSRVGGRTVASMGLDQHWLTEREDSRSDSSKARGVLWSVGAGVLHGVSGVVVRPIQGAREGGATGFITGVASGAVGVLARPVAGFFDGAANTADSIVGALASDEMRQLAERLSTPMHPHHPLAVVPLPNSTPLASQPQPSCDPATVPAGSQITEDDFLSVCRLFPTWRVFLSHAPLHTFLAHCEPYRDKEIVNQLEASQYSLTNMSRLFGSDVDLIPSWAEVRRARHLVQTLGAPDVHKYASVALLVWCCTWEELRNLFSESDFRAQVAPQALRVWLCAWKRLPPGWPTARK